MKRRKIKIVTIFEIDGKWRYDFLADIGECRSFKDLRMFSAEGFDSLAEALKDAVENTPMVEKGVIVL